MQSVYDLFDDEVFDTVKLQSERLHIIDEDLLWNDSCLDIYKSIPLNRLKVLIIVPNLAHDRQPAYDSAGVYYVPVIPYSTLQYESDLQTRLYRFFQPITMIVLTRLIQYLREKRRRILIIGHGSDVDILLSAELKFDDKMAISGWHDIYDISEENLNRIHNKLESMGLKLSD